jgi:hypothetical protein
MRCLQLLSGVAQCSTAAVRPSALECIKHAAKVSCVLLSAADSDSRVANVHVTSCHIMSCHVVSSQSQDTAEVAQQESRVVKQQLEEQDM